MHGEENSRNKNEEKYHPFRTGHAGGPPEICRLFVYGALSSAKTLSVASFWDNLFNCLCASRVAACLCVSRFLYFFSSVSRFEIWDRLRGRVPNCIQVIRERSRAHKSFVLVCWCRHWRRRRLDKFISNCSYLATEFLLIYRCMGRRMLVEQGTAIMQADSKQLSCPLYIRYSMLPKAWLCSTHAYLLLFSWIFQFKCSVKFGCTRTDEQAIASWMYCRSRIVFSTKRLWGQVNEASKISSMRYVAVNSKRRTRFGMQTYAWGEKEMASGTMDRRSQGEVTAHAGRPVWV